MSVHPLAPGHEPASSRQTTVGHVDVLDAWLGTVARPGDAPVLLADGGHAIDWNAPACPAELTYDTAEQLLPSGVRIVAREGNRRLMFEARAYEVMLRVASDRQSQQHEVAGQVLFEGLPLPGATVRLDRSDPSAAISTDQTGQFRLPPLVHGAYGLKIAVEGAILMVPPIALQ
jgi:hypothetical protein